MDLNPTNIEENLLPMLEALEKAHFVSMDFELSGISTKNTKKRRGRSAAHRHGVQTLQERYEDIVDAAEKYGIIQVGITIVIEDQKVHKYMSKTYNMYLSFLDQAKVGVSRSVTLQDIASEFLLANEFNFQDYMKEGVPYLSQVEEDTVRARAEAHTTGNDPNWEYIDPEVKAWCEAQVEKILEWKDSKNRSSSLEIGPEENFAVSDVAPTLTSYQRYLLHKIVARLPELSELTTRPLRGNILVLPKDKERDEAVRRSYQAALEVGIQKQKGVAWFVEALSRGKLQLADPLSWMRFSGGKAVWIDKEQSAVDFARLRSRLRDKRTVLVGHNIFTDLVYLYTTFFGPPPNSVQDFADAIHNLFPRIVDTKFMATQSNSDPAAKSGLEDVKEALSRQTVPAIETDPAHTKYLNYSCAHEAGYDSDTTAHNLIRQSAKLKALSIYSVRPIPHDPYADLERAFSDAAPPPSSLPTSNYQPLMAGSGIHEPPSTRLARVFSGPGVPFPVRSSPASTILGSLGPNDNRKSQRSEASSCTARPDVPEGDLLGFSPPVSPANSAHEGIEEMMPGWEDAFWGKYSNRLRVFGTVEGELHLGKW